MARRQERREPGRSQQLVAPHSRTNRRPRRGKPRPQITLQETLVLMPAPSAHAVSALAFGRRLGSPAVTRGDKRRLWPRPPSWPRQREGRVLTLKCLCTAST